MLKWESVFPWGRRASDDLSPAPALPRTDLLLESMIAHEQVDVLYQPVIEPGTGRIVGAEALVRSAIADSATDLFNRAAASRLDERLSRVIQRKALRRAAAWEGPLAGLAVSINLLPCEIIREDYDSWLLDEIATAGIAASRVTIEITESALVTDQEAASECLTRLRSAGVTVAVDDFGSGYASFSYLTNLPIDVLKIDRGLISNIVEREPDRIVVKALIKLAHDLGLKVLVEGVESIPQLALLSDWGCDLYQGFLGAGALAEEELTRFVAAAHAEAA
jgi:EAL domain-containing protein (putative c-di-GMP-specific phosphodiesterase class I)